MVAIAVALHLAIIRPGVDRLDLAVFGHPLKLLAPRWLLLSALVPLLVVVSRFSLVDFSRLQRTLALCTRSLLLLLLVFALARPAATVSERRTLAVYAVDVSTSVSDDQLQAAQRIVDRAWAARGDNEMRLMTFAAGPRVLDIKGDRPPRLTRHSDETRTGSDIQSAIQQAYGLISPDRLPRVVVVSDGNQTAGDALTEVHRARQRGVRVFSRRLPARQHHEALVRALLLPKEVRLGAPFELTAIIDSTDAQEVKLTLYKDGFINGLDGQKTVQLSVGTTKVKFKSLVREAGLARYRLAMSGAQRDTWPKNNVASALLPVRGKPRVLYVEGEPLYAGYFQRALQSEKIDVVVRGPHGIPTSASQLGQFDLVVISDVPALYLSSSQMLAIERYLRDLGGGFLMTGGPNSFGAGGYYGTTIEKILPVRLDTEKKRDQPSVAIVLCIDRSGSMSGTKLELAKEAARATAELLGRGDLIGVVAFDSTAHVTVRLQRAANRLRILNNISQLNSGGGTSIKPALQEAYAQLRTARAKVKHVILLSDGQSSYGGIPELVDDMARSKITVSAVGVGGGADRTLLQMIAERGSGRFYHTNDANNIPKIFTKETTQVARSAVIEDLVKVRIAKRANMIDGIDFGRAPYLRGYVSTKAKPFSETILVSDYGEPILSVWRVGLGKSAAFTSDVKNRWAVNWLRWSGYNKFWAQVVRELMRRRVNETFAMDASVRHGRVTVAVDAIDRADRYINGLESDVTLFDPDRPKAKVSFPLEQTSAGRYEASLPLDRYGAFLVRAHHRLNGKLVAESLASLAVPYPSEYTHLVPNNQLMRRLADAGGGAFGDSAPGEVFAARGEQLEHFRDRWPLLIYFVLGLFLLDVLLRRVRLFGYRPQH